MAELNAGGRMTLWSCAGSPSTCSASAGGALTGWSNVGTTPASGSVGYMGYPAKDAKLVLVPRTEGTYDRFALVQRVKTSTTQHEVHLWKWCASGTKWLDVGTMPTPPDNVAIPDMWHSSSQLGLFPSSGMGLFMTDGVDLHATYIACHQDTECADGSALHDAVVWSAPAKHADLCP